jgi:heat shock protein HtpX
MKYIGIQTQKRKNNFRSLLLLMLFRCLVVGLTYLFILLAPRLGLADVFDQEQRLQAGDLTYSANRLFIKIAPYATGGILLWFVIAYFSHIQIIRNAAGAHSLERKKNKRVYNIVENLCMSQGMKTPKINIIDDDSLNAFASGINDRTYTVTLSSGIIEKLNDDELEGVIAHELSHIRNRDVRLLIISIVFVGIFAMLAQMCFRILLHTPRHVSGKQNKNNGGSSVILILLLAVVMAAIGYFFSTLMRFAISRKREYLADAAAAEMTKKPYALASALRKISADPDIEAVTREDIAQLFIEHPGQQARSSLSGLSGLFATHPPIQKRIEMLEQF